MILDEPRVRRSLYCALIVALSTVLGHRAAQAQKRTPTWTDVRTVGPFICRATFPLDDYHRLLDQLAELQNDLSRALRIEPASEAVTLYLLHDKRAYHNHLRARMPQVPNRRALFVKGAGPGEVFVYRNRELAVDVRHECTHALLHASLPMVPLWLDEGLAEYFEVPRQQRPFRKDYLDKLRWSVRLGNAPRLARLEQIRQLDDMDDADYRAAWAWVHFMLHGPAEAHRELVSFLADIHAHVPPGRLSERLERRLPEVDRRLAEHFKGWKIPRTATRLR